VAVSRRSVLFRVLIPVIPITFFSSVIPPLDLIFGDFYNIISIIYKVNISSTRILLLDIINEEYFRFFC
jgi:hypothetical protein